jgi:hypothetical protein
MITIKEARSKSEMKDFVMFPFQLYKDNPNWIPPIISDEIDSFNPRINPAFEHAEAYFYLAYRDGKIVGRTAAIINWSEVTISKSPKPCLKKSMNSGAGTVSKT